MGVWAGGVGCGMGGYSGGGWMALAAWKIDCRGRRGMDI